MSSNDTEKSEKVESISDAEWQVAKVLWQKSPQTAAEIIDALRPTTDWNPKTIHTLIRRLVQKNVIAAKEGVTPYTYCTLLSEAECTLQKTRSFIDKIYNGSFNLMVARFVKEENLSSEEIAELKKILNGK
jgi:BlaI family transcriptional regulator, penicillinase repressor